MKFSWKIFFCTILIVVITFSVGSFFLIDYQFRSEIERATESAYEQNRILSYSISIELENALENLSYADYTDEELQEKTKELIEQESNYISMNQEAFRLNDSKGNALAVNGNVEVDTRILKKLSKTKRGYEIVKVKSDCYVHVASPLLVRGELLYLETMSDITGLFTARTLQYRNFSFLIGVMILLSGGVIFMISNWLTRPIKRLTKAVQNAANGDLQQRVPVKNHDEIGVLSENFNSMSEQLEKMVQELKDSNQRQEDFVDSFAHELKTPLTSMIGYADMLRSKKMTQEDMVLSANYIVEEGKRLESLSMKLMELIVLKNQEFTMRKIAAEEFLESVKTAILPIMKQENIDFQIEVKHAVLLIEPDFMKTVCLNLLDNARKAIDADGKITLSGRTVRSGYCIMVCDNGKGMEAQELERITEAFYMVDKSRARAQGGAGLGLALCKEIIDLHHGKIRFKSHPGKGTEVFVYLPIPKKKRS